MEDQSDRLPDELKTNAADTGAALVRATVGLIPVGSLLSELISKIIPNQRDERFAKYLHKLDERLKAVEVDLGKDISPIHSALFEDGAHAAVRATTEARIDRIAKLVADGFGESALAAEDQRRFIAMLGDLFDEEIMVLSELSKFAPRVYKERAWSGGDVKQASDQALRRHTERTAIEKFQIHRLVAMGLASQETKVVIHNGGNRRLVPEMRHEQPRITQLGLVLLERLGLMKQTRDGYQTRWERVSDS